MSKINIKMTLINNDQKEEKVLKGLINNNILKYINNPYKTTFNYNTLTLINESEDTRLKIEFDKKKTEAEYLLKKMNKKIYLDIKTTKIDIDNNNINIEYTMKETNEKFKYRIEVIE